MRSIDEIRPDRRISVAVLSIALLLGMFSIVQFEQNYAYAQGPEPIPTDPPIT